MSDEIEEVAEVETEARKMGWVPEEDWKGDPEKWRPAEEFVERGKNIVPIMRERLEKLEKELQIVSKLNKEELKKVRESAYEQAKKEYDKQVAELNAKKFEAIQSADVDEYQKVEKQISSLPKPEEPKEVQPVVNPVFEDWNKKNPWYAPDLNAPGEGDRVLTLFANAVAADVTANKPGLPPDQFYAEVERMVKAEFPQKFQNQRREQPDLVGTGHKNSQKVKKSFSDLPDEAKSAYKRAAARLKSVGRDFTKEDYVKQYFEE
jgi:hypothetical protein